MKRIPLVRRTPFTSRSQLKPATVPVEERCTATRCTRRRSDTEGNVAGLCNPCLVKLQEGRARQIVLPADRRCVLWQCFRERVPGEEVCGNHLDRYLTMLEASGDRAARQPSPSVKRSPSKQSGWRRAVAKVRALVCVAAGLGGCEGQLECDHVWPKSQGGPYAVENGSFLCHRHHRMKTDSQLQYRYEWLDPDQVAWLAAAGWVAWDDQGQPCGRGWKHFAPMTSEQLARRNQGGTA